MAGPKKQNPAGGPGPFAQAAHLNEHREVCLNPGQLASAPVGIDRKQVPAMSSLEIAELVELRHDNVRRTIEMLAAKGVITLPQSEGVSNEGPRGTNCYRIVLEALRPLKPIAGMVGSEGVQPPSGGGVQPVSGVKPIAPLQPAAPLQSSVVYP